MLPAKLLYEAKCSEDQQREAGGQHPYGKREAPTAASGTRKEIRRPEAIICEGNIGVYMMLLRRLTSDCTAPQSPHVRPTLMGYLGFKSSFQ